MICPLCQTLAPDYDIEQYIENIGHCPQCDKLKADDAIEHNKEATSN